MEVMLSWVNGICVEGKSRFAFFVRLSLLTKCRKGYIRVSFFTPGRTLLPYRRRQWYMQKRAFLIASCHPHVGLTIG